MRSGGDKLPVKIEFEALQVRRILESKQDQRLKSAEFRGPHAPTI
jgi:hypothetical protein